MAKPRKVAKLLKNKKPTDVLITCEDELDAAPQEDKVRAAKLPGGTDHTKCMAIMSKCPPANQVQSGEVWGLIDSGSGVVGTGLSSICPGLQVEDSTNKIMLRNC